MTDPSAPRLLRADLHVHSLHSGFTKAMPAFRSRDCYSSPEAVYRAARARGMDLVAITDHDSIAGCLELAERHPDAQDILMGEEIECRLPGSVGRLHIGAFGLTERHHRDVQPLRGNAVEAAAYLRSEGVALVLHHPAHLFRGGIDPRSYVEALLPLVHAVEVRNATMAAEHNDLSAAIVEAWNGRSAATSLGQTGGSDAHILRHVGTAWTEAPGRTREEFLESLKRGDSRAGGVHGSTFRLAVEIYGVMVKYWLSLVGFGTSGLTPAERARAIVGSIVLMPIQFSPMLVSIAQKRAERRRVAQWRRALGLQAHGRSDEQTTGGGDGNRRDLRAGPRP
jgi:predicted metal-dependent phosphoesterase TrpH